MKDFTMFEERTNQLLDKYHIPGCIVAIAEHGEIVYEQTFGYRDMEKKLPIDRNTVFGVASLTKSYTCVALMQLVEQGKLDLQAPVIDYLPSFSIKQKEKLAEITVHQFMTHSSGLPPLPSLDYAMVRKRNDISMVDYLEEPSVDYVPIKTYDALMAFIGSRDLKLIGEPGEQFSYSNDAFGLLGALIENVSGMTYEAYVEEHIFKPCRMEHSHFTIEEYKHYSNIATCYERYEETTEPKIYPVQDWWDAPAMRATGFLKSTAQDMLAYSTLFLNKGVVNGQRILLETSVEQMVQPHIKMDPESHYGYGLGITKNFFGETLIEHGGSLQSVSAKFGILRERNVSVIVLANLSNFPASRVMGLALNTYFGRDIDAHHFDYSSFEVSEEMLVCYEGTYRSGEGMNVQFEVVDRQLIFYYNEKIYPIRFIREHVILAEIDDVLEPVELVMDERGNATAVSIYHRIVPKVL